MTDLTRDKLIEAMAERLNHVECIPHAAETGYGAIFGWVDCHPVVKDRHRAAATLVLDAIGKVAAVVPREANEEMLMAAQGAPTAFEAYPAIVAVADLTRPALSP